MPATSMPSQGEIIPRGRYSIESFTDLQITPYAIESRITPQMEVVDDASRSNYLHDLLALTCPDESEVPVSKYAVAQALSLLKTIITFMRPGSRRPRVVDDGEAGIRMTWRNGEREIRIAIPASSEGGQYLYWEAGLEFNLIPNFTAVTLFNKLAWLYGRG